MFGFMTVSKSSVTLVLQLLAVQYLHMANRVQIGLTYFIIICIKIVVTLHAF